MTSGDVTATSLADPTGLGGEAHAELKRCGCMVEAVRKLDDPLCIASCELVDCTPPVHRVFELASSS